MIIAVQCATHFPHKSFLFSDKKAYLPVLMRDGQYALYPWGNKIPTDESLPIGPIVNLADIKKGRWDRFFPKPVQLPITAFNITNHKGMTASHSLVRGQQIQGMLINDNHHFYVYIVTITTLTTAEHAFWPKILLY